MLRTTFKGLLAVAVVGLIAADANAFHHRRWGSCGSSGGWYGSCGSSGGSWGSSGGSWGSSGGSWGSSGGSWGSSGGSWGSSGGSWGSSGGSWGSSGGGSYAPATPMTPATPAPTAPGAAPAAPAPSPPAPSDTAPPAGNSTYHPTYGPERTSALLAVAVPADAKVFVNDRPTSSTGSQREFISRDLAAGAVYNYEVRAEFVRDGKPVSETKSVQLTAGQTANLDFAAAATTAAVEARTTLTVHVPADAKLYLADHETQATGEVREFSTNRLPAGSQWATYAVKAVIERDGQPVVREQTISLKAGESRDVTINFDEAAEKVATKTDH